MPSKINDGVLTAKEESLVQAMLIEGSQRKAMIASEYSTENMKPETIDNKASAILRKPHVKARFDQLKARLIKKVEEEGLFTATDVLKKIHDIVVANEKEDPKTALKGLELYGKHLKLFTDKVEHSGEIKSNRKSDDEIERRIKELESK